MYSVSQQLTLPGICGCCSLPSSVTSAGRYLHAYLRGMCHLVGCQSKAEHSGHGSCCSYLNSSRCSDLLNSVITTRLVLWPGLWFSHVCSISVALVLFHASSACPQNYNEAEPGFIEELGQTMKKCQTMIG